MGKVVLISSVFHRRKVSDAGRFVGCAIEWMA